MTFLPCIYVLFHLNVGSSQCSWPLTASGNPEITRDQQKDRMVARKSWKQRPGGRGSVCVPVSTMPGHQCLRQSGLERSQDIAIEICRHHCVTPILPPASHPIQRVWGKLRHRNVTYLHPWPLNLHKQSNSCCVFLVIPSSIFSPWIPESLYSLSCKTISAENPYAFFLPQCGLFLCPWRSLFQCFPKWFLRTLHMWNIPWKNRLTKWVLRSKHLGEGAASLPLEAIQDAH